MPPFKKEFELSQESSMTAKPLPDPIVHSAKVQAELLTGDSKWDVFLQHLQAARDTDVKEVAYFTDLLKHAYGKDVVTCQINIAAREACIKRMDEIMQLPATIVRASHGS